MTVSMSGAGSSAPTSVVVLGVSGAGKSLVAQALATATGATLAEGDDFHSAANVAKMASGRSLDDEDRWPWLRAIAGWIDKQERAGRSCVVTCSALKRSYRDLLREGNPSVRFCQLDASTATLLARVKGRRGHYMPPSLLRSQLRSLQPLEEDEPGGRVSAEGDVSSVLRGVLAMLADDGNGNRGPRATDSTSAAS